MNKVQLKEMGSADGNKRAGGALEALQRVRKPQRGGWWQGDLCSEADLSVGEAFWRAEAVSGMAEGLQPSGGMVLVRYFLKIVGI